MNTIANVKHSSSPHWYHAVTGVPMHQIPTSDGKKMKSCTLADARKLNLLPSVTTIIDAILRKPALEAWKTEQAVLACLTAPRLESEATDAFVHRVLQEEQQQVQEARAAADLGTKLHAALEAFFQGEEMDPAYKPWVMPAAEKLLTYGALVDTERVLVGNGYAGTTDLILDSPVCLWLWDLKTTKRLPEKGAWSEHRLQLSAYAAAQMRMDLEKAPEHKPIRTGNLYVSTANEGKFVIWEHEDWTETYQQGFVPLLAHWQWANRYWPSAAPVTVPEFVAEPGVPKITVPEPPKKRKLAWTAGVPTPTPCDGPSCNP